MYLFYLTLSWNLVSNFTYFIVSRVDQWHLVCDCKCYFEVSHSVQLTSASDVQMHPVREHITTQKPAAPHSAKTKGVLSSLLSLPPSMSVLLLHGSWLVSPDTLGLLLCRALVLTSLSAYANLPTQCVGSVSLLQGCHCLRQPGLRAPYLMYSPVVFYHSYPLNVSHETKQHIHFYFYCFTVYFSHPELSKPCLLLSLKCARLRINFPD